MSQLYFPEGRRFDLACLGRLAVDLYAQQIGCALEDVSTFAKYLGGSSANIASGAARLGLKSAMISRVGDEQMGSFLLNTLQNEGCDVSQVRKDPHRLTGLVLLGIKDRDTFPLLFYRENCADMALDPTDIDDGFIGQCRALLITGTHLSTPHVRQASLRALKSAAEHRVARVLDIDFRPVLWGLVEQGDGERRYVPDDDVTTRLQATLGHFELIIGTEDEFLIAGGIPADLMASLRAVRAHTSAVLVVKLGPYGCAVVPGDVPDRIADALTFVGEDVEVLNVLGAGDAFAAGLLTGLLRGRGWEESARMANACGAIVVSRHGCAPAMPTQAELRYWLAGHKNPRPDTDAWLSHLHRVTAPRPEWRELYVLAFDHRSQFYDMAATHGRSEADIAVLKRLILRAVEAVAQAPRVQGRIGVLVDDIYGEQCLHDSTGCGWWVGRPVELPGSRPLRFEAGPSLASRLQQWPREHVVKCLVQYHPDDPADLRLSQEDQLRHLWEATRQSGHELLLEVIPPDGTLAGKPPDDAVLRSVRRLYNLDIRPEWWKLGVMAAESWNALDQLVAQRDPHCRGAVILGLNQPLPALLRGFAQARAPVVKGFMIGRSVWQEPAVAWLRGDIEDAELVHRIATSFRTLIAGWQTSRNDVSMALLAAEGAAS